MTAVQSHGDLKLLTLAFLPMWQHPPVRTPLKIRAKLDALETEEIMVPLSLGELKECKEVQFLICFSW